MDEGALVAAFNTAHERKNTVYEKSRFTTDGNFTVKHFAGHVVYNVSGFLEKNNDSLFDDLQDLLYSSSNAFIQNAILNTGSPTVSTVGYVEKIADHMLLSQRLNPSSSGAMINDTANSSPNKKMTTSVTVSLQFRSQLDSLISTLKSTSPHFIKCIKPNARKVAGVFDGLMVLEQLRYCGALEVVRIRRDG